MGVPGLRPEAIPFITEFPSSRWFVIRSTWMASRCRFRHVRRVTHTVPSSSVNLTKVFFVTSVRSWSTIRIPESNQCGVHTSTQRQGNSGGVLGTRVGPTWRRERILRRDGASILNGRPGRDVTVHTKAGKLRVEWPENAGSAHIDSLGRCRSRYLELGKSCPW
jgi:hypothetical protein